MDQIEFLTWVRSTGLNLAVGIFILGTVWRLFEIYALGRKPDLAVPRRRLTRNTLGAVKTPRCRREVRIDRKSTRLNSSHSGESRMPSSA